MNLFPEQPRKDKTELYYQEYEEQKQKQWNNHVRIRMDVRYWLQSNDLTPILKELTEKILIDGPPKYKETETLFARFLNIINPDQPPEN